MPNGLTQPLVQLAEWLGFWPSLVLFGALLLMLIAWFGAEAQDRQTQSVFDAFQKVSQLREAHLTQQEFEIARANILKQNGISEREFEDTAKQIVSSTDGVVLVGILGGLTGPSAVMVLILFLAITSDRPIVHSAGWWFFFYLVVGAATGGGFAYLRRHEKGLRIKRVYWQSMLVSWLALMVWCGLTG